jgi:hypothetical protein
MTRRRMKRSNAGHVVTFHVARLTGFDFALIKLGEKQ